MSDARSLKKKKPHVPMSSAQIIGENQQPKLEEEVIFFDSDLGGIPTNTSIEVLWHNTVALSEGLSKYASNATIVFPKNLVFSFYNGIYVEGLENSVLQIDGELHFQRDYNNQSFLDPRSVHPACLTCNSCSGVTLTSSVPDGKRGILNGGGPEWWGSPLNSYKDTPADRPYFILFNGTTGLNINNLVLQDSPLSNLVLTNVHYVEIHNLTIVTRRTSQETHGAVDLTASNTGGINIAGHHVYVHDVDIWNQDDCIAINDNLWSPTRASTNMTFERINASGVGLTIGSISGTTVRDIVFRDSYLYKTLRGITLKFREPRGELDSGSSVIENIYFENITIESPIQWPIWIGPAQQKGDSISGICNYSPCSICWPTVPFQSCSAVPGSQYRNITFKNITIRNPLGSPGVILGDNNSAPIIDLTFDNVQVVVDPTTIGDHVDLESHFPSLSYPVHDEDADRVEVAFYVICGVLILTLAAMYVGRWIRKKGYSLPRKRSHDTRPLTASNFRNAGEDSSRNGGEDSSVNVELRASKKRGRKTSRFEHMLIRILSLLAIVFLTAAVVLVTVLMVHRIWLIPNVDAQEYYFVCEGVERGIALGNTYPVPSCFEDQTHSVQPHSVLIIGSYVRKQVLACLFLVACYLIYFLAAWRLARRANCFKKKPSPRAVKPHPDNNGHERHSDRDHGGDGKRSKSIGEREGSITTDADLTDSDWPNGDLDRGHMDEWDYMDDRSTALGGHRKGVAPSEDIFSKAWSGMLSFSTTTNPFNDVNEEHEDFSLQVVSSEGHVDC